MEDLQAIADRLVVMFANDDFLGGAGLDGLLGENIEVRHYPAVAQDGVRSRSEFEAGLRAAAASMAPRQGRLVLDGRATIRDRTITVDVAHEGRLSTGPYRFGFQMAFVVDDGQIVRVEEHFGDEALATQAAVRAATAPGEQ